MSGLCSSFRSSIWFNLNLCGYFLVSDSFLMFSVSDVMSLVTEVQLGVSLQPPSWCFVFLDGLLFYFFLGFQSEWVLVVTLKLCFPGQRLFTQSSGVSQPWVVPLCLLRSWFPAVPDSQCGPPLRRASLLPCSTPWHRLLAVPSFFPSDWDS